MKKIILGSLVVGSMMAFTACGGEGDNPVDSDGSNSNPVVAATGTGYYVDSAVEGVSFACGGQSGTTDKDGKFTFEVGKECKFTLAGIELRTTTSDKLTDGGKILEDNPDVQRFLQSIDNDGNPSNGIQITPEVLAVLTTALAEFNSGGGVPKEHLEEVVAHIEAQVPTFEGVVKTPEQVAEHFAETVGDSLKELLGGKTFYAVGSDQGYKWLAKVVINADVTLNTLTELSDNGETHTITLRIDGNKILQVDEDKYSIFAGQTSDYLIIKDYPANGSDDGETRFYFSETVARAYYDSLSGDSSTGDTYRSDINPIVLAGKTIYGVSPVMIESTTFNANMTTATWKNEYGVGDDSQQLGNTGSLAITVNSDNSIDFGGQDTAWIKTMDSTQLVFESITGDTKTFYFDLESAKSVYNNQP